MLRHRSLLLVVAVLAAIGLAAAACGNGDTTGAAPATTTAATSTAEATPNPAEVAPDAAPDAPDDTATTPEATTVPTTTTTTTTAGDEAAPDTATTAETDGTGDAAPTDPAADFPVTIQSDGGTWTLESAPQRIVSLSPNATEILFAIGAGDQVVAVDGFSYHPPEAPVTDLSGFDPNVEAVTTFDPDLVVVAFDANDLVAGLGLLDIPVLVSLSPLDIEAGYVAVAEMGLATGHAAEAEEMNATMRAEIAAALARAPDLALRVYHELDETYYSASSAGFIGAVYTALGTANIADAADPDGYGFPQLTEEYIIEADPELIVITDSVAYTAADVAARPGWEQITAVRNGDIVVVNGDVASRWGPRLPLFVAAVADALAAVAAR